MVRSSGHFLWINLDLAGDISSVEWVRMSFQADQAIRFSLSASWPGNSQACGGEGTEFIGWKPRVTQKETSTGTGFFPVGLGKESVKWRVTGIAEDIGVFFVIIISYSFICGNSFFFIDFFFYYWKSSSREIKQIAHGNSKQWCQLWLTLNS